MPPTCLQEHTELGRGTAGSGKGLDISPVRLGCFDCWGQVTECLSSRSCGTTWIVQASMSPEIKKTKKKKKKTKGKGIRVCFWDLHSPLVQCSWTYICCCFWCQLYSIGLYCTTFFLFYSLHVLLISYRFICFLCFHCSYIDVLNLGGYPLSKNGWLQKWRKACITEDIARNIKIEIRN